MFGLRRRTPLVLLGRLPFPATPRILPRRFLSLEPGPLSPLALLRLHPLVSPSGMSRSAPLPPKLLLSPTLVRQTFLSPLPRYQVVGSALQVCHLQSSIQARVSRFR